MPTGRHIEYGVFGIWKLTVFTYYHQRFVTLIFEELARWIFRRIRVLTRAFRITITHLSPRACIVAVTPGIMETNGMSGCCHSYRNNDFLHYVFSQVFKDPAERITAVV